MAKTITQRKLEETIAVKNGLDPKLVHKVVSSLIDEIGQFLEKGDKVVLPNLVSFSTRISSPRRSRNISTGELMTISSRRQVKAHASRALARKIAQIPKNQGLSLT